MFIEHSSLLGPLLEIVKCVFFISIKKHYAWIMQFSQRNAFNIYYLIHSGSFRQTPWWNSCKNEDAFVFELSVQVWWWDNSGWCVMWYIETTEVLIAWRLPIWWNKVNFRCFAILCKLYCYINHTTFKHSLLLFSQWSQTQQYIHSTDMMPMQAVR